MNNQNLVKRVALFCAICAIPLAVSSRLRNFDPPVMGWSSWNTYRVNISESLVKKQADAMVPLGLKYADYSYINIDDSFICYCDDERLLHAHPERFPNGKKVVADYIHSLFLMRIENIGKNK